MKKLDLRNVRIYANTKADAKDALDLIGEDVYLSNDADFKSYKEESLIEVSYADGIASPFLGGKECVGPYRYLIRAKDAKFKKEDKAYKVFRPYEDIVEFCSETGCEEIGADRITIRSKRRKQECVLLFTGYSEDAVHLGGYVLTFEALVKHYEFYNKCGDDNEWCPFGVEVR